MEDTVTQCGGAVMDFQTAVITLMNPTATNGVKNVVFQKISGFLVTCYFRSVKNNFDASL